MLQGGYKKDILGYIRRIYMDILQ